MSRHWLLLSLVACSPTALNAQEGPALARGIRVRVSYCAEEPTRAGEPRLRCRRAAGTIDSITQESLAWSRSGGPSVVLPVDKITRLEISRARGVAPGRAVTYPFMGLIGGAVAGGALGSSGLFGGTGPDFGPSGGALPLETHAQSIVVGAAGGLIGLVVGLVFGLQPVDDWRTVRLEGMSLSLRF